MKKTIKIILCFVIFVILLMTNVRAEDKACKISLSSNKTTLNAGDKVTITLTMSDITKSSGIVEFISALEYDSNIFEIIPEDDEELIADLEIESGETEILYNGENDTTVTNPWYLLYMESDGSGGVYGSSMADPQTQQQVVGKINFKVKEDAISTSTTISLQGTEVYDSENVSESENEGDLTGYEIADSDIKLQINGVAEEEEEPDDIMINEEIEDVEDIADEDVPYTGIEDVIPFALIVIVFGIVAYIKYRKYKEI